MKVVIRGSDDTLRSWGSFSFSGIIHGVILGWVAFGTLNTPPEPRRSLYDMEIRANAHRIVWYSLKNRLPDVTPAGRRDPRPPRARFKFNQTLVAGNKELDRPPQMIWMPAPEASAPKPLPLPNVVAVQPARPVRQFAPPPEKRADAITAPALPEAPEIARAVPGRNPAIPAAELAAPVRKFQAPEQARAAWPAPALPDAPEISVTLEGRNLSLPAAGPSGPVRAFRDPRQGGMRRQSDAAPALPEAPAVKGAGPQGEAAVLIDAPALAAPVRAFSRPAERGAATRDTSNLPTAPGVSGPSVSGEASLAIAGLNPAVTSELPAPPGSREAGFSAGPALRPDGGTGAPTTSTLQVPGLLARGGDTEGKPTLVGKVLPFTRERLADVAHFPPPAAAPEPAAPRSGEPPEAVLRGRYIYTVAFQMPNVTSYSGSWHVWFAEHEANERQELMRAPVPLRKVDPKYIASAAAEGIEGKVRLYAIIRKDGRVDHIVLLKGIDARLDQSSQEALGKWLFEPARRGGAPIDVDAVFEIPFHLATKTGK